MSFRIMDETSESGDFRGWRKIELLVDSGAADSVLPEGMMDDYKVAWGQKFKQGVNYLTADGGRLPNMGESTIPFVTGDRMRCQMTFQVASVTKPILAVDSLTRNGMEVHFTASGGRIVNKTSKKEIAFQETRRRLRP